MTTLKFHKFSRNMFFDQSIYEYANERGDDVIASQFSIHFRYTEMTKNFIFGSYEENVRLALIPL